MSLTLDDGSLPRRARTGGAIEIALLNNLSDAGLEGGERQFADLLRRAAGPHRVRLRFFSLPAITRGAIAKERIASRYTPFSALFAQPLDGLIITGCEPRTDRLEDEAYWPSLCSVVDRAKSATRSTVFSCLAAHAAVLHLDGVPRRRRATKLSGLYAVEPTADHPMLAGLGGPLHVPHSRWNGLADEDLAAAGYTVLTRGAETGADAFAKDCGSLFLFLQGHPEYDSEALLREYRRDVLRYLDRVSDVYPNIPENCVTPDLAAALERFQDTARRLRSADQFSAFPLAPRGNVVAGWSDTLAHTLFANWLDLLQRTTAEHAA